MTKDMNKGIDTVRYNELSLPIKIEISTPDLTGTNEYFYTATGAKLHVAHQWVSNIFTAPLGFVAKATVDYCGNKIYENGELTKILIDNGYIDMTDGQYYRYVKDHLGNIRAVQGNNGVAIQSTQYYPYGMSYQDRVFGQEKQPYLFNGKELDNISGLNWYDFSARYYDDVLGRFTTPDPMAEMYYSISPYAAFGGNPLVNIDPSGMSLSRDWYEHDNENGTTSTVWRDDNAKTITIDDQVYNNIGENYLSVNGDNATLFTQHTNDNGKRYLRSYTYNLGDAFITNCLNHAITNLVSSGSTVAGKAGMAALSSANFRHTQDWYRRSSGALINVYPEFDLLMIGRMLVTAPLTWLSGLFSKDAAKTGTKYSNDLVKAAQQLYPKKAGVTELHHIRPQYLGGVKNGPLVPLNGSYHQVITNEFRSIRPYGLGPVGESQWLEIMNQVYSKFPLPPGY